MGSYAEWESGWPALSGVRPRSGKREMRERESGVGLALSRCACELGGSSEGARSRISSKGHWNVE